MAIPMHPFMPPPAPRAWIRCQECKRTVRTVAEIRNCDRCKDRGVAVPANHSDSDYITPLVLGLLTGYSFMSETRAAEPSSPPFEAGGGDFGGGGSSATYDPPDSGGSSDSGGGGGSDGGGGGGGGD